MKSTRIILAFLCLLCIQSCGVITKTRYGNGFRLHLPEMFGKRENGLNDPSLSRHSGKKKPRVLLSGASEIRDTTKYPDALAMESFKDGEQSYESKEPEELELRNTVHRTENEYNSSNIDEEIKIAQTEPNAEYYKPYEPTVRIAGWLFLIGVLISNIPNPVFALIGASLVLISFILALIGLVKINRSGNAYRGKGLAMAIILIFIISLIIAILSILFFLMLLSLFL